MFHAINEYDSFSYTLKDILYFFYPYFVNTL